VGRNRFEWTWIATAVAASLGFVWLAWALSRGELTVFDETLRARLHSFATPSLTLLMQFATLLGSQPAVLAIAAGSAFVFFRKGRRDAGTLLLISIGGAELLENVLKVQFHRQRPEPFFDSVLPGSYSFPSGHALLAVCLYGILAWILSAGRRDLAKWLIWIGAAALVEVVGVSRVYLGVHHPTDVIGGYLVAIAWITTLRRVRGRIGNA